LDVPVFHELHAKFTFRDRSGVVPREAPFLIWNDSVDLPWTPSERAAYDQRDNTRRVLARFPGGVHVRPVDGPHGDELYLIWTYDVEPRPFRWPPRFDRSYGEIVLRGSARMLPGMSTYFGRGSEGVVDGGYYCKTQENRPLVGPLAVKGAYVLGALSGFGVMGAHAGADLLAAHLAGDSLPDYARWFLPSRYEDPAYRTQVERWGPRVGQL
jgi:glycine/D-amino acid oxidase-like deaminating enzyme